MFYERTKHIDIDSHIVREKLLKGIITTTNFPTNQQPFDIFTKSLSSEHLHFLTTKLGVCDMFQPSNLRGDDNSSTTASKT